MQFVSEYLPERKGYINANLTLVNAISCTKSKQTYQCQASEMYSASDLFGKDYSQAVKNYGFVAILSTKYGLPFPDDEIFRYDLMLSDMNSQQRKERALIMVILAAQV